VFIEVIKLRSVGWPSANVTGVFMKRGNLDPDTHSGRMSREDEGRDCVLLPQVKERWRFPANPLDLGGGVGAGGGEKI